VDEPGRLLVVLTHAHPGANPLVVVLEDLQAVVPVEPGDELIYVLHTAATIA
jgi:hypothetical protein